MNIVKRAARAVLKALKLRKLRNYAKRAAAEGFTRRRARYRIAVRAEKINRAHRAVLTHPVSGKPRQVRHWRAQA